MNKIILWLPCCLLVLAGCSSSVRPLYSDTNDVTPAMLARVEALGLSLSETGSPVLAKGLEQADTFCKMHEKELQITVMHQRRGDAEVPVVHVHCE